MSNKDPKGSSEFDTETDTDTKEGGGVHGVFESAFGGQTLVTIVRDGVETVFTMPRTDLAMVGPKRAVTLLDAADRAYRLEGGKALIIK